MCGVYLYIPKFQVAVLLNVWNMVSGLVILNIILNFCMTYICGKFR